MPEILLMHHAPSRAVDVLLSHVFVLFLFRLRTLRTWIQSRRLGFSVKSTYNLFPYNKTSHTVSSLVYAYEARSVLVLAATAPRGPNLVICTGDPRVSAWTRTRTRTRENGCRSMRRTPARSSSQTRVRTARVARALLHGHVEARVRDPALPLSKISRPHSSIWRSALIGFE